jgi:hypothetical protein
MPLRFIATDGETSSQIFDGYLDFENYRRISNVEISVDVLETTNLASFDRVSRITFFNILHVKGVYSTTDFISVKRITEKLNKNAEAATLATLTFVLSVQAFQQIKEISKDIANILAHTTGGITGPISGPIYAIAIAIIDIIALAKIVIEAVKLGIRIAEVYVPPVVRHNATTERKLLEKAINHLGYSFETNISEMDNTVYHPGRPPEQGFGVLGGPQFPTSGLPKVGQPGETLGEFISIMITKYYAQVAIIDNTVHLRSKNDPFWEKNSTYILPDFGDENTGAINLNSESRVFNVADFKANTTVSFVDDATDAYTTTNWKGTNFMVIREPIDVNNQKMLLHDGLDKNVIPISLGTRKDSLDQIESAVFQVLVQIDALINLFGGNSNLAGLISSRIGAFKTSERTFSNPKFIWVENNNGSYDIPVNHRDLLSAKSLYVKYHAEKSFVNTTPLLKFSTEDGISINYIDINTPNFGNQKALFNVPGMPFGYSDYLKVVKNSYFATNQGDRGKIEGSKYIIRQSIANQSYWIREIWTKNLKETFIEPV